MELSHSFEKIGDRGAEILRKSSKDAEHKQRSTKRRLDEAIEKLDRFSPVARHPSSSATEEEIANLRTYVEEVSAWIESIRPTAELMSSTGIPEDEEGTPPDVRHIGHPPPSKRSSSIVDPDLVASLFERLAILEERVSGVEGDRDDLERGQKTFIQQSIDERLPPGTFAAANESKARNEDIQTLKTLSCLAGELKADGGELGSEVKGLQLSSSILEQQKILYAENTELKQRLSKVETEIENQRQEISITAEDIRRLRAAWETLAITQAPPPPTAETQPEQISEILAPFLLDSVRSDVMGAFTALKQNMAHTVTKSQEDVCTNLWGHLEPILKMVVVIVLKLTRASLAFRGM
ncbi:hypothetical protein EIP86_006645 [Pleurotus ostreatoroseus]|nr:hypothetical protein EIP86_006645 [Pleurotus ostreatoroseus]